MDYKHISVNAKALKRNVNYVQKYFYYIKLHYEMDMTPQLVDLLDNCKLFFFLKMIFLEYFCLYLMDTVEDMTEKWVEVERGDDTKWATGGS